MGVIQKVAFTEHKRKLSERARWVDSETTIAKYTNQVPFCLTNSQVSSVLRKTTFLKSSADISILCF